MKNLVSILGVRAVIITEYLTYNSRALRVFIPAFSFPR
jgi:hypothetical protein